MGKPAIAVLVLVLIGGAIGAGWYFTRTSRPSNSITLHGNVDFRQANLAFNDSGWIVRMGFEEGARVKKGQVLAQLETERLEAEQMAAKAALAAQQAVANRLHNGTRPEEIAQAKANVQARQSEVDNARQQYDRLTAIASKLQGRAVSRQDVEDALARLKIAQANLDVSKHALALAVAGPRKEDIAQAEAQMRAAQAQLKLIETQLSDTKLIAPADGVIRSRLMEVGEMASPQRAVYSLAITDPKWVRAYVSETDLGRISPGERAQITIDSFPDHSFDGWIGFISPVAEFTPKPVQTEQLRTSLVYEARVYVHDPQDQLRLGMPATVKLPPNGKSPASQPASQAASQPATHETGGVS